MKSYSLKELLNYESGDSWNGSHFRWLSVKFNEHAQTVTVASTNSYYAADTISQDFDVAEATRQIEAGDLNGTKHLGTFVEAISQIAPSRA